MHHAYVVIRVVTPIGETFSSSSEDANAHSDVGSGCTVKAPRPDSSHGLSTVIFTSVIVSFPGFSGLPDTLMM